MKKSKTSYFIRQYTKNGYHNHSLIFYVVGWKDRPDDLLHTSIVKARKVLRYVRTKHPQMRFRIGRRVTRIEILPD